MTAIARAVTLLAAAALAICGAGGPVLAGPPSVVVSADPGGASGAIDGQVDIDAPPAVVWRVLVDPGRTAELMVGAKSCKVLSRDPAGHWDVREQISKGGLFPSVRSVIRSDYQPYALVRFHRIDGDIKLLEGEWRLTPLDGGARTRLEYRLRVTAPIAAPDALVRAALRRDTPTTLANVRDASQAAARP